MVEIKIPEDLPNCKLLDILASKVNQRRDTDFDFFGNLENFRKRVSNEARQINELFPEYTPHDEQYHFRHLFHVADRVLGGKRLEAMNSAELFILAISLYGHDWGMAVSEQEKQYILNSELSDGTKIEDLWILPDERDRLIQFATEKNLKIDSDGCFEQFPIGVWREYVRQTHALRSSERIKRFFSTIDGGIADAASRVCAGHWITFNDLQNYNLYPPNFSVLHETINLRALAVYLRLVDLLDLGDDRTPYIIWKFVAPRDSRSKMEWEKHLALRPVTCPEYQNGRIIVVDGSTNNHEVYAALEDLRILCENELRGCNNTLSRMNDSRHMLDLYHIEWRVAPQGFEPISIQFEFDRERMFEILSDEIYNGDPYVFLRELLQNSIDAIRMRREVLKGIEPTNIGVIYVDVKHGDEGDAVITWRDDGVGMDEYIVKKYLATAGNSYYQSSDFENQGLKMDPISKFGIGILSCFMVADRIEIETFRDPYLPPESTPIKVIIPAVNRQFRIEKKSPMGADVGTAVTIFVQGNKVKSIAENEIVEPLDVTDYLSIVAGFVEFPIVITEDDRKTIVLHPDQNEEEARQRFGEPFSVHKIDLSYPWSDVFYPQDLSTAREMLKVEQFDINSDLKMEGYNGVFNQIVPNSKDIYSRSHRANNMYLLKRGMDEDRSKLIRWESIGSNYSRQVPGPSESSKHPYLFSLYRDGILLSSASLPVFQSPLFLFPQIIINIPKTKSPKLDLGRLKILGEPENWFSPVYDAYLKHLNNAHLKELLTLEPLERLYQLVHFYHYYNIQGRRLFEIFPIDKFPVPFLDKEGGINVIEWQELKGNTLYLIPEFVDKHIFEISHKLIDNNEYDGVFNHWSGERCILLTSSNYTNDIIKDFIPLCRYVISQSYQEFAVRFLESPWEGNIPMCQKVLYKIPEGIPDTDIIFKKASETPELLNTEEMMCISREIANIEPYIQLLEFREPFEQYFGYGNSILNINHPLSKAFIQIIASLQMSQKNKTISLDHLGVIQDELVGCLIFFSEHSLFKFEKANSYLSRLFSIVQEEQLCNLGNIVSYVISSSDFIPGTLVTESFDGSLQNKNVKKNIQSFGNLI